MLKLARRARGHFVTLIEIRVHLIRVKPGHIWRTQLSLRSALNFTIFPARTERFKLSFSPSTTKERNNINAQLRSRDSIGTFKRELSIHTCMRLDACALNYYSYRIAVKFSPVCLCGQSIEDISHSFSSL